MGFMPGAGPKCVEVMGKLYGREGDSMGLILGRQASAVEEKGAGARR